jgi:hypothetical protein
MTKHFKYSKGLHWVTLFCFLFPFFYTGCGPSAKEKAALETAEQDTIVSLKMQKEIEKTDSLNKTSIGSTIEKDSAEFDRLTENTSILRTDTTTSKTEKDSETLSLKISNKFEFLRPILVPKEDTYTGIAVVMDGIPLIPFLGIFISFLLLIISLIVKYMDHNARKTIVLLDILVIISLYISEPYSFDSKKLWGYWVAMTLVCVLSLYDLYIFRRLKTE